MIMSFQAPSAKDIKKEETAQTMFQIVLRQFLEHRMAVAGSIVIIFFLILSLGADVISSVSGIDPNKQNLGARYQQPLTRVEYSSDQKETEIEKWIASHPSEAAVLQKALVEKQVVSVPEADALYEVGLLPKSDSLEKLKSLNLSETSSLTSTIKSFSTFHTFG